MLEQQSAGTKTMLDLHGLSVKEVKQLLEEYFSKSKLHNITEIYLITGKGNHVNSNGARGVLKTILPKLLKPYCQDIIQVNPEVGAYKIILKPQQEVSSLKDLLISIFDTESAQIECAKILKQKSQKNNIEAMLALSAIHLHQAIKGFNNINEGIALLVKAKQLGSLDAYVLLGTLYHEGIIIKQNHQKAFNDFLFAANKGHPVAQYYVAVCYLHGKGVKYNDEQAVIWMKKSADQNDVYAQASVSDFYLLGKITQQNMELGIYYKTKAAKQDFAEAQIDLGRCYATGHGVKQDYKTAFKWYFLAAQHDKSYAAYQVGTYLLDGRSGLSSNPIEAFGWFLKSAELGDADGQAHVARQYLFAEGGIKQNIQKGLEWATKSIEQKNRYGYYAMAKAYEEGVGVNKDIAEACRFMRLSAEAGYLNAEYKLGLLLIKKADSDLSEDYKTGIACLKKAAAQNHDKAKQALHNFSMENVILSNNLYTSTLFKPEPEKQVSNIAQQQNDYLISAPINDIKQEETESSDDNEQSGYFSSCTIS